MGKIAKSFVRIAIATMAALGLLWLGLLILVRQPSLGSTGAPPSEGAEAERLEAHVRFLAEDLALRNVDHLPVLEQAAAYVEDHLRRSGAQVESQPYGRLKEYRNVIARFGPETGPRVIVGAHYDAFGMFGTNPGADDNASGTAGLLELARLLSEEELVLPVELVAYSTEEPPHFASPMMGSAVHAGSLADAGAEVEAMLCLEMIGYYSEEQSWPNPIYGSLYPDRGDFIALVGRSQERALLSRLKKAFRGGGAAPVYSFAAPIHLPGLDASDHRSYWQRTYPAVLITDTAFMRNPNYHTPNDRPETLDFARMASVVDGLHAAVLDLAGPGSQ